MFVECRGGVVPLFDKSWDRSVLARQSHIARLNKQTDNNFFSLFYFLCSSSSTSWSAVVMLIAKLVSCLQSLRMLQLLIFHLAP